MANFQSITPVKLGQAAITTGYTTLYTTGTDKRALLKDISVCNTTTGSLTFYISLVPTAGTAGADNALFFNALILPNSTIQWTGTHILNAGDTIQVKGSAAGITITASGGEAV